MIWRVSAGTYTDHMPTLWNVTVLLAIPTIHLWKQHTVRTRRIRMSTSRAHTGGLITKAWLTCGAINLHVWVQEHIRMCQGVFVHTAQPEVACVVDVDVEVDLAVRCLAEILGLRVQVAVVGGPLRQVSCKLETLGCGVKTNYLKQ